MGTFHSKSLAPISSSSDLRARRLLAGAANCLAASVLLSFNFHRCMYAQPASSIINTIDYLIPSHSISSPFNGQSHSHPHLLPDLAAESVAQNAIPRSKLRLCFCFTYPDANAIHQKQVCTDQCTNHPVPAFIMRPVLPLSNC